MRSTRAGSRYHDGMALVDFWIYWHSRATYFSWCTRCKHKQISPNDLRVYCSAIRVTTTRQPEYTVLMKKLKARCSTLQPLLSCDELDTIFSGIETLGKPSLQHLNVQHNLNVSPESGVDSMKTMVVNHITSGRCQASTSSLCLSVNDEYQDGNTGAGSDLEMHVLQLAAKKTKLSKTALRRVLKSKDIEFGDNENVGKLRWCLRSYITKLCKGKQSEWSCDRRNELESKHHHHLNEILLWSETMMHWGLPTKGSSGLVQTTGRTNIHQR